MGSGYSWSSLVLVSTEWTDKTSFFDQELRHRLGKRANKRRGLTFANGGTEA